MLNLNSLKDKQRFFQFMRDSLIFWQNELLHVCSVNKFYGSDNQTILSSQVAVPLAILRSIILILLWDLFRYPQDKIVPEIQELFTFKNSILKILGNTYCAITLVGTTRTEISHHCRFVWLLVKFWTHPLGMSDDEKSCGPQGGVFLF